MKVIQILFGETINFLFVHGVLKRCRAAIAQSWPKDYYYFIYFFCSFFLAVENLSFKFKFKFTFSCVELSTLNWFVNSRILFILSLGFLLLTLSQVRRINFQGVAYWKCAHICISFSRNLSFFFPLFQVQTSWGANATLQFYLSIRVGEVEATYMVWCPVRLAANAVVAPSASLWALQREKMRKMKIWLHCCATSCKLLPNGKQILTAKRLINYYRV